MRRAGAGMAFPSVCARTRIQQAAGSLFHPGIAQARKREGFMTQTKGDADVVKTDRAAIRALAVGACAFGAAAIGALAVGAMAIGRLRILEARIEKLSVGTLTVDRLDVRSR
jgi:hypothetical protein